MFSKMPFGDNQAQVCFSVFNRFEASITAFEQCYFNMLGECRSLLRCQSKMHFKSYKIILRPTRTVPPSQIVLASCQKYGFSESVANASTSDPPTLRLFFYCSNHGTT